MKLLWTEGRNSLDSNYEFSLVHMKGQVRKLRKEPEVLLEYHSVIKGQLVSRVIERVAELEESDRVYYNYSTFGGHTQRSDHNQT